MIEATGPSGAGIDFYQGGMVSNASSGVIIGSLQGIRIDNALGTVTNYGTIEGTSYAVDLAAGGTVTNYGTLSGGVHGSGAATTVINQGSINGYVGLGGGGFVVNGAPANTSALITGYSVILASGSPATIVNYGTLFGTGTDGDGAGIDLSAGGTIVNKAGALIERGGFPVRFQGSAVIDNAGTIASTGTYDTAIGSYYYGPGSPSAILTLANTGTISSYGTSAVYVYNTGGVTIGNYGLIQDLSAAGSGIVISGTAAATLTNAGTIVGQGGTAVALNGTGNQVILDPGATFQGVVIGGTAGAALELAAGTAGGSGTLSRLGTQYLGFGTITVDAAADWTIAGSNTIGAGVTLTDFGTLTNTGTINAASGSFVVNSGSLVNSSYIYGRVTLAGGGYLYNQTSGSIVAGGAAIGGAGAAATVVNAGTIEGTRSSYVGVGVSLAAGGSVINGPGGATTALISGYSNGVVIAGGTGTVTNYGTIETTAFGYAVSLAAGGTVTNYGTISGRAGVYLAPGGTLINGASAAPGAVIAAYYPINAGTVVNYGSVLAYGYTDRSAHIYVRSALTNQPGGLIENLGGRTLIKLGNNTVVKN